MGDSGDKVIVQSIGTIVQILGDSDSTKNLLHLYYQLKARFRSELVKTNFYFSTVFHTDFCSLSEASLTSRKKG